ncbi:MAG: dihydroneopterin aldolase [Propionibacteriaceae bacterium]
MAPAPHGVAGRDLPADDRVGDRVPSGGDRIALRGISGFGHHGVFADERQHGQLFVVDLVCHLDLERPGRSDDLADTLDYSGLAQRVVDDIERDPLDLIEALAVRIADTTLTDRRVDQVEVTVHKPHAPMPVPVADAMVTVTRSRS